MDSSTDSATDTGAPHTYEPTGGSSPVDGGDHEPRTMRRLTPEGRTIAQMMSEIGDGLFVAWTNCATCHQHANSCACKGGPLEPAYITKWRHDRFKDSLNARHKATRDPYAHLRKQGSGAAEEVVLPGEQRDLLSGAVTEAVARVTAVAEHEPEGGVQ